MSERFTLLSGEYTNTNMIVIHNNAIWVLRQWQFNFYNNSERQK